MTPMDSLDKAIVLATQEGLPLCHSPFEAIGKEVGASAQEVMARMRRMQDAEIIRRIGAVPNHYALGFRGNGMTVWDVSDSRVKELGRTIGQLAFVSHAYLRPRHEPDWPYNLFAMVHGRDRDEVWEKAEIISQILGQDCYSGTILFSTRILKKTGLRLVAEEPPAVGERACFA